jgi:hypothetical protein
MRNLISAIALLAMEMVANAATYEITVRNEAGTETRTVQLPPGGAAQQLKMTGTTVELTPASGDNAWTLVKLYTSRDGKPVLSHTARIGAQQPVRIAYTVCGTAVTYYSPKPEALPDCTNSDIR